MLAKRTQDTSDTIADRIAIALQDRKQGFLGLEILTPSRPWPHLQTSPCQVCSWARAHRTSIPFVLSSGPLRKSWVGLAPSSLLSGASAIGSVHHSYYKKTQLMDSNALPNLTLVEIPVLSRSLGLLLITNYIKGLKVRGS